MEMLALQHGTQVIFNTGVSSPRNPEGTRHFVLTESLDDGRWIGREVTTGKRMILSFGMSSRDQRRILLAERKEQVAKNRCRDCCALPGQECKPDYGCSLTDRY